jgi:acetylornithine deacetylase/succinyl-diaminopimelate desuccinylase-like protein
MAIRPFELDDLELWGLTQLARQPSHDIEGEIAKIRLIEEMLRRSNTHLHHIPVGDGRNVLVAEKGSHTNTLFTLMLYAHVDTVEGSEGWHERYELKREAGRISFIDAWDMQAAIQQMISLAYTIEVPDGVNVFFAFAPDEERNSAGVEALLRWHRMREVDLVISSEIGPHPPSEPSHPVRVITSRMGSLKIDGTITTQRSHGALPGAPNALTEYQEAMHLLRRIFARTFARKHPLHVRGEEISDAGSSAHQSRTLDTVEKAEFAYMVRTVPGSPLERALAIQRCCFCRPEELDAWLHDILTAHSRVFRDIHTLRRWAQKKVSCTLIQSRVRTSYEPYELDPASESVQLVSRAVREVCHPHRDPVLVGAPSWADSNKFVAAGYPCVDVPNNGDKAHETGSWVEERSVAMIREVFRHLIEVTLAGLVRERNGATREGNPSSQGILFPPNTPDLRNSP